MKLTIVPRDRKPIDIEVDALFTDKGKEQDILVKFGAKMFCSTPNELKKIGLAFVELSEKYSLEVK